MADTMSTFSRQPAGSSPMAASQELRRGEYHVTFKAVGAAGLLGDLGPFLNTDITNPRELYNMLSESRQGELLASLSAKPQSTVMLPPLQLPREVGCGQSLDSPDQRRSYPDLRGLGQPCLQQQHGQRKGKDANRSVNSTSSVRRWSSLQDVSTQQATAGTVQETRKTLRLILKTTGGSKTAPGGRPENAAAAATGVKFKDARPSKDLLLPPIEGVGGQPSSSGTLTFSSRERPRHDGDLHSQDEGNEGDDVAPSTTTRAGSRARVKGGGSRSLVPLHHQRRRQQFPYPGPADGAIFPRGHVTAAKRRPSTPTFDSYPEAYWELRSPTVQDPGDLKEDMIDRERYRLQQMSALRLRAIDRDALPSRLELYRKWQQQQLLLQQHQKQQQQQSDNSSLVSVPPATATPGHSSPAVTEVQEQLAGKQQKMLVPIRNQSLEMSIGPVALSPIPRTGRNHHSSGQHDSKGNRSLDPANDASPKQQQKIDAGQPTDDQEQQRQSSVDGGSTDAGEGSGAVQGKKRQRATVINLCIEHDRQSSNSSGNRSVKLGPNSQSDETSAHPGQGQKERTSAAPGSVPDASSRNVTACSTVCQSGPGAPGSTSVPAPSSETDVKEDATRGAGGSSGRGSVDRGGKQLLTKFKQLEVFGERSPTRAERLLAEDASGASHSSPSRPHPSQSGQDRDSKGEPAVKSRPYLPHNRPPTYRMDTRLPPPGPTDNFTGSGSKTLYTGGGQRTEQPTLNRERNGTLNAPQPDHSRSKAPLFQFRFHNGEVIVSRQGSKPAAITPGEPDASPGVLLSSGQATEVVTDFTFNDVTRSTT